MVSQIIKDIDSKCRYELAKQIIVSERDYVSSFSTRIRDESSINMFTIAYDVTSKFGANIRL